MTKVAKEVSYVLAHLIMHRGRKNAIDENKNSLKNNFRNGIEMNNVI